MTGEQLEQALHALPPLSGNTPCAICVDVGHHDIRAVIHAWEDNEPLCADCATVEALKNDACFADMVASLCFRYFLIIEDILLQNTGTLRLLSYSQALPLRFREEVSFRVEMSEDAIRKLRVLRDEARTQRPDKESAEPDRGDVKESGESEDTMILQAVSRDGQW